MSKESFFKVYSADYSKNGYEDGIKNSTNKEAKNKFIFFKAIHPINYVWKFNNAFDSYMRNYDLGYLDGQRVNNQVYNDTNQTNKGITMNNNLPNTPTPSPNTPPSLNDQLALAESLYRLFLQAKNDINDIGTEINKLKQQGATVMIQEYFDYLELNCLEPRLKQLREFYVNIEEYDLPKIKKEIEEINNMMHGIVSGTTQSTKFYNFTTANITCTISSLNSALQNANLLDKNTQKQLAISFKKTLQDTSSAMNEFGSKLRQNIDNHGGMFRQFFTNFYNNNAEPRLDELRKIWMNIENNDIPEVDKIINKF